LTKNHPNLHLTTLMDAFADDRPIAFVKQGIRTLKSKPTTY